MTSRPMNTKNRSSAESLAQTHNGAITPANSLVGCFLMTPRSVFEDAGGINEHYGLGYHIEAIFSSG